MMNELGSDALLAKHDDAKRRVTEMRDQAAEQSEREERRLNRSTRAAGAVAEPGVKHDDPDEPPPPNELHPEYDPVPAGG